MKAAYLIRHPSNDGVYIDEKGYEQTDWVRNFLGEVLPDGISIDIRSSESPRAYDMAKKLLPFFEEKAGAVLKIRKESGLYEGLSIVGDDEIIETGKKNADLVDPGSQEIDHQFLFGHKKNLIATANGISENTGIAIPPKFKIQIYNEERIKYVMGRLGIPREEVIKNSGQYGVESSMKIPLNMGLAGVMVFDFEEGSFDYHEKPRKPFPWPEHLRPDKE